ncbi:hypothetical protein IGA_01339 [Bacillus cereus HuA3-9]|uniref:Uncharacterized protein n=1 Tax=Bacillus cereus HuA3-9 TaxID=1053205 RepID=R8DCT1_BACCE|nr:hypothetical protein IGA_01339 [Bacillus cereus HuA3-9]
MSLNMYLGEVQSQTQSMNAVMYRYHSRHGTSHSRGL